MATTYNEDGTSSTRVNTNRGNPILGPAEQHLGNKKNVAPAAKFIQRQLKLKRMLEGMD